MLDILSSPLKGYLAQTLQYYLSKYLKDIHLEGLGFFGSDLVLNDLEIKRHVLQTALDIPSSFDFSRGFIRELRIHIPWTQILSQPIEVKLYTVELILTAKDDHHPSKRRRRQSNGSECSSVTLNTQTSKQPTDTDPQIDPPKSTWLQSMLSKILANVSIQVNNLVLKYEQDDIVLSLTLGLLDIYSANDKQQWARAFDEPNGPDKMIAKRMDAKDISIFLDRYTSDRLSVDIDSDIIHRQVIGYEVPVLRRTSFGVRVHYALEPTPFAVPATPLGLSSYLPSRFHDPFHGYRLQNRPSFAVVDVFVKELNFSLSDRQVQMLVHVTAPTKATPPLNKPSPLHRAHSTPLSPSPSMAIGSSSTALNTAPTFSLAADLTKPSSTDQLPTTDATASSWSSWALGMIVGDPDDLEAELLQDIQAAASMKTAPPGRSGLHMPPFSKGTTVVDEIAPIDSNGDGNDDIDDAGLLCTLHLLTVRVSIEHISLTLRCHPKAMDSTNESAFSFPPYAVATPVDQVEYVPVANVGLVQVASFSPAHTKISKAADPVAVVHLSGTMLSWATDHIHVKELVVEVETIVGLYAAPVSDAPAFPPTPTGTSAPPMHHDQVLRVGTFHSTDQRSIVHPNVNESLFAHQLQNESTWNVSLQGIRQLRWDPAAQTHVYQYSQSPSTSAPTGEAPSDAAMDASPFGLPLIEPLSECSCTARHSVASIEAFWRDVVDSLTRATTSSREPTLQRTALTDEIMRQLHTQYDTPHSNIVQCQVQAVVEAFQQAVTASTTSYLTSRRRSKEAAGVVVDTTPTSEHVQHMLVPPLVALSAQYVGHSCRSRATTSALRLHMVETTAENTTANLADRPSPASTVVDMSVGVVDGVMTLPALHAAVDFVQRIEFTAHAQDPAHSHSTVAVTGLGDSRFHWMLHASRVSLQWDLDSSQLQLALNNLWVQSVHDQSVVKATASSTALALYTLTAMLSLDEVSARLDDTTLVTVQNADTACVFRQSDAPTAWTEATNSTSNCFDVQASVRAITCQWSRQVGVNLFTNVFPALAEVVHVPFSRQWTTDWSASYCHPAACDSLFQGTVAGLAGHFRVAEGNPYHRDAIPTGVETSCSFDVASITCDRSGRQFVGSKHGTAEPQHRQEPGICPWVQIHLTAWAFPPNVGTAPSWTPNERARVFRSLMESLSIPQDPSPTAFDVATQEGGKTSVASQVDCTANVQVAAFEADWRHVVALVDVVPPFPALERSEFVPGKALDSSVLPVTRSDRSHSFWIDQVHGWTCTVHVRMDSSTWTLSRHVMMTFPQLTLTTMDSPPRRVDPNAVGALTVGIAVAEWGVECNGSRVFWSDGITATMSLYHAKLQPTSFQKHDATSYSAVDVDLSVALDKVSGAVSPLDVVLVASIPLPQPASASVRVSGDHDSLPIATDSIAPDPTPLSAVAWCIKGGVQVQDMDIHLVFPSNRIQVVARNLSTALRTGNYPPLHPVAPTAALFVDSQVLLHDLSVLADRTLPRICPLLHGLPSSSLLGILLCLDPLDIHAFATAAGIDHRPPDAVAMEHDSLLRWQYATYLARQCITAPATTPRPRSFVQQPLVCTAHSFAPNLSYQESVFLSLFVRNYGGSGSTTAPNASSPATMYVTGHMEAIDLVADVASLQSIATLVDTVARTTHHGSSNSSAVHTTAPATPATTHSNATALPCVAFQADAIRIFFPTDKMVCLDSVLVESAPGYDHLSMEGLSSPPFTPLQRKHHLVTKQVHRPRLSPTPEPAVQSLLTRLGNVYAATVQWKPAMEVTGGPFEVCMARVTPLHTIALAKMTYIVPPVLVSVDIDVVRAPEAASQRHVNVSLHATKVVVDLPRHSQYLALMSLAQRYLKVMGGRSHDMPEQLSTRPHPDVPPSPPNTMAFGCRVVLDGIELHVGTPTASGALSRISPFTPIMHVRVGCLTVAHNASTGQGSFAIKNVVVGFQQCDTEEALIFGPFADPSEWQVTVEKYADTLLSATWTLAAVSDVWVLSGLVEVQGVQCHVCGPFLSAMHQLFTAQPSSPSTHDRHASTTKISSQAKQPLVGVHMAVSIAGVPVEQCKLKLLWSPSAATYSSTKDELSTAAITFGPVFASLHGGYIPAEVDQLNQHRPRLALHQHMPLTLVEAMGTVQGIRVAVAGLGKPPTYVTTSGASVSSPSTWSAFESRITSPDPASVLVQDFQVRGSMTVKHVVQLVSATVCSGGDYVTDVQVEATPIDGSICFETWTRLDGLVADLVGAIDSPGNGAFAGVHGAAAAVFDDFDAPASSTAPTLNDFTELEQCADSTRLHPLPGELLLSSLQTESNATEFRECALMPLTGTSHHDILDELVRHVNEPWEAACPRDETATTFGHMRWTYHLPRRVCRLVGRPLPLATCDAILQEHWPRMQVSDRVTRLCDVWCELRCWSMADSAFVSVGSFFVPWERQRIDGGGVSSFASALRSWVEPSPSDDDREFDRRLESTHNPREYRPRQVRSAQQWELRWRLPVKEATPSSPPLDHGALSKAIGDLLAATLRVSSFSEPDDLTGYSLSCSISHVQLTLRRGQGELHDVARLKCTDVGVGLHSTLSSYRVAGTVSGELQNMVTLSSIPVLPPVHVAVGGQSMADATSFDDNTASRPHHSDMPTSRRSIPTSVSRILVTASPVHLQLTPYAVKCLLEWPTLVSKTPQDLTDMRILLTNGTGEVVQYRQVSTLELRQLAPHTSVVYSWQSIDAPLQLQFALTADPNHWSAGCDLNQPGVMYRECPINGSFWVGVSVDGIQTKVTLRGSVMLHNYTTQSVMCRLNLSSKRDVVTSAPPCPVVADTHQECACTAVSFMARNDATLRLGLQPDNSTTDGDGVAWSQSLDLVPSTERLESAAVPSTPRATFVSMVHPTSQSVFHAWVVVARAISPVLQRSNVVRVAPRYTWVQVSVWPILHVSNTLPIPLQIDIIDKSTKPVQSKALDPSEQWALNEYNPLHQHTLVFARLPDSDGTSSAKPSSPVSLLHFDVPRFVSAEDSQDLVSYPSSAMQIDVPNHGFVAVTRHSPGVPMRCIALHPRFRLRNDLPVSIVVRPNDEPKDGDDAAAAHVHIPPFGEQDMGWTSFLVGVSPHETLVWSPTAVSWQTPDAPHAIAWSFEVAPDKLYIVRGVVVCHSNSAATQTRRITIAPQAVVSNVSDWPLCLKPTSSPLETSAPTIALPPQATWWMWESNDPQADEASTTGRKSSSLAWIRRRLSSVDSTNPPRPNGLSFVLSVTDNPSAKPDTVDNEWSQPIRVHTKMPPRQRVLLPRQRHQSRLATVHKTITDSHTTTVLVSHDPQPPVVFINHVDHPFGFATHSTPVVVPAQATMEYDWDIQLRSDDTAEIVPSPSSSVFDAMQEAPPPVRFRVCDPGTTDTGWSNVLWMAEGIQFAKWTDASVVLLLTMYKRAGSWVVRIECVEGPYSNRSPVTTAPRPPSHHVRIDVALEEVAVSLLDEHAVVNSMYRELFRLSAKHCHVSVLSASTLVPEAARHRHQLGYLAHVGGFSTYVVRLGSVELLHLFDDCNFPVILATTPSPSVKRSRLVLSDSALLTKELASAADSVVLRVILVHPSEHEQALPYLHTVNVAISPVVIQVEDSIVAKVMLWVSPLESVAKPSPSAPTAPPTRHIPVPKLYIEHLTIQPMTLTITARAIYGLDRTPLTLSSVELSNVFCDADQLGKDIAANYVADALVHSPMVIMSLNVLGNPAGFFRDVSAGVSDLVRLPLLAVSQDGYTPYSLTRGVLHGTASLLTHASVAALTSVSGVAQAISNSMDHLALAHQPRAHVIPTTFASGLSGGLASLGSAVVGAATGVVTTPLTLFRDNQARGQDTGLGGGLFGVGKGLVGIVAQPMSGVASLVSMTSQGLLVEMGFGPAQPTPLQVAMTRNEALHVRWKVLSEWNVTGDIHYARALYLDDEVPGGIEKSSTVNDLDPQTLAWLLPRDLAAGASPICKVLLVVTLTHVFVVDESESIIRHIPLGQVSAMEQNVLEPTKFDLGIGLPALKVQWYRFRLAAMDRRRLGRVVAASKKW